MAKSRLSESATLPRRKSSGSWKKQTPYQQSTRWSAIHGCSKRNSWSSIRIRVSMSPNTHHLVTRTRSMEAVRSMVSWWTIRRLLRLARSTAKLQTKLFWVSPLSCCTSYLMKSNWNFSVGHRSRPICHPQVQVTGENHAKLWHRLYARQGGYWRDW